MEKWRAIGLFGFICLIGITLYMMREDSTPPHLGEPGDPDEPIRRAMNYTKLTREYQIDLDKHAWRYNKFVFYVFYVFFIFWVFFFVNEKKRAEVAREFFAYLNKISNNYFNFTYESHVEEVLFFLLFLFFF